MKKKIIALSIIWLSTALYLSAQTEGWITIENISGRVQIQKKGAALWEDASMGLQISPGTIISTGFKSSARLNTGTALIDVEQLTRLTIEELMNKEDSVTTSLYLNGGRINTEVSRESVRQDFTVRSSVATASVRGTGFSFDGMRLRVRHGAVLMQSGGHSVMAYRGDRIKTSLGNKPQSRVTSLRNENKVSATLELFDEEDLNSLLDELEEETNININEYIPDPEDLQADLTITIQ